MSEGGKEGRGRESREREKEGGGERERGETYMEVGIHITKVGRPVHPTRGAIIVQPHVVHVQALHLPVHPISP